MLIGEHRHTIDEKNRLSLPAKFRQEMGKKLIVARGLDHSIYVFTPKEWKVWASTLSQENLRADSRGFNRFMFGGASETQVDSIGRILIPDFLVEWAALKTKVVVVGVENRVEIWDEKTWLEYSARVAAQAEVLAEKLGSSALK